MIQHWGTGNVVSLDPTIEMKYNKLYEDLLSCGVVFPENYQFLHLFSFSSGRRPSNLTSKETDRFQESMIDQAEESNYQQIEAKIDNLARIRQYITELTKDGSHHAPEIAITFDMYLAARQSLNNDPLAIQLAQDIDDRFEHIRKRGKSEIDVASRLCKAWGEFKTTGEFLLFQLMCAEILKIELGIPLEFTANSSPKRSSMPTITELKQFSNSNETPITPVNEPKNFSEFTVTRDDSKEDHLKPHISGSSSKREQIKLDTRDSQSVDESNQSCKQSSPMPPENPFESFGVPPITNKLQTHLGDNKVPKENVKIELPQPAQSSNQSVTGFENRENAQYSHDEDRDLSPPEPKLAGSSVFNLNTNHMDGLQSNDLLEETLKVEKRIRDKSQEWQRDREGRDRVMQRHLRDIELDEIINKKSCEEEQGTLDSAFSLPTTSYDGNQKIKLPFSKVDIPMENSIGLHTNYWNGNLLNTVETEKKLSFKESNQRIEKTYQPKNTKNDVPTFQREKRYQYPSVSAISKITDPTYLMSTMALLLQDQADIDKEIEALKRHRSIMVSQIESKRLQAYSLRSEAKAIMQAKQGTESDAKELKMLKHTEHIKKVELATMQSKLELLQTDYSNYKREKETIQDLMPSLIDISAISHKDFQSRSNSASRKPSPPPLSRSQGAQFLADFNNELNSLISMSSFDKSYNLY